jgi:class 3 adenylate cyclase
MSSENKELVRRIAKLVKLNKQLLEKNISLTKEVETLREENSNYKKQLNIISLEDRKKNGLGRTISKPIKFDMVTVLFAGIHNSPRVADSYESHVLLDDLDDVSYKFEKIVKKYNIIRAKTIGDTYMCVGGVPDKNSTNPIDVVLAALELRQLLLHESFKENKAAWDIRFGIHTGSIFTHILGKKKYNYDIKGDTVNLASRMEGWSESARINITAMTYELIKEFFSCEYYGKMPARFKGNVQMYTVKGIKSELSINGEGQIANDAFKTRYALLKFSDLQEFVLDKLERELPDVLYYHNVKHTVDVVTQVELIGWGENISDEELLLLKTAALFHDAGHIIEYDDHEYHGTVLARQYLPKYGYEKQQIESICNLIMATKLPPNPKDKLEAIMCDADLDYLGRSDMIPVSGNLFKELKKQDKIESLNDWNKLQVKFISDHQYFTDTARNLREVNKQKQIDRLKQLIV